MAGCPLAKCRSMCALRRRAGTFPLSRFMLISRSARAGRLIWRPRRARLPDPCPPPPRSGGSGLRWRVVPGTRHPAAMMSEATSSAALRATSGRTEVYVSAVSTMLEWPSMSCTTFRSTFAAKLTGRGWPRRAAGRAAGWAAGQLQGQVPAAVPALPAPRAGAPQPATGYRVAAPAPAVDTPPGSHDQTFPPPQPLTSIMANARSSPCGQPRGVRRNSRQPDRAPRSRTGGLYRFTM